MGLFLLLSAYVRNWRNQIMQLWELILIAVSLSMDAFAVSICKG